MKQLLLIIGFCCWFSIPQTVFAQTINGDDILTSAIYSYTDSLSELLPIGSTVFINDHSDFNGVTSYFGKFVAMKISNRLTNNKNFTVVDRNSIDLIIKEQKFQRSGIVDEKTVVALGEMTGANIIVFGTITEFEKKVIIDSKIINVKTGEIIGTTDYTITKTNDVANLISTIILSSEQQKMELEKERQKILQGIKIERDKKLASLEIEERQLKQKIIDLENEFREKSVVLKEYKIKQEKLKNLDSEIEKIYREIDKASNKISLLKVGMTRNEVKQVIGERFRLEPYTDCGFFGKYILYFEGGVLVKGCMIGDKDKYGYIINKCSDCSSHSARNNQIKF